MDIFLPNKVHKSGSERRIWDVCLMGGGGWGGGIQAEGIDRGHSHPFRLGFYNTAGLSWRALRNPVGWCCSSAHPGPSAEHWKPLEVLQFMGLG